MSTAPISSQSFAYRAQTIEGQALSGTLDAESVDHAKARLESLRLRVLEMSPAAAPTATAAAAGPLRGVDFVTFNQQLAHLTAAGMPIERGLRLIAQDLRRGRVSSTIRQIADELDRGVSLALAFERYSSRFPPAYGRLIDAGVRTNNLSGMLLSLGRHMETVARLRAAMWRAVSYPLMVFVALCLVVAFVATSVLPKFQEIFRDFGTALPWITQTLIDISRPVGIAALVLAGVVVVLVILSRLARGSAVYQAVQDAVVSRLPLVGPVVRRSLVSRWCDATRLGVMGGLDLPAAMRTAGDAVGSARLRRDTEAIIGRMESGQPIDSGMPSRGALLPGSVTAAIELASQNRNLPETLGTLSEMYRQQALARVGVIPAVLTPMLLAILMLVIGAIILALFAPFVSLIESVSGGKV
jgi:type IV pilus assembly protein PilC